MNRFITLTLLLAAACSPKPSETQTPDTANALADDSTSIATIDSTEGSVLDYMAAGLTTVPPEAFNNSNIKTIWLRNNNITELPPEFANIVTLEELSLGSNPIKDMKKTLDILAKLPNLRSLDLEDTGLKHVPDNIKDLKNLQELFLWANPLDSTEVSKLKKALPNVTIQ